MVMEQGDVNLAGPLKVLSQGGFPEKNPGLFHTPAQTREIFESFGWSKVAAFQTRNPMHRSHEYLAKVAIEVCDGVLVHSLLGALKPGDIPAEVRTRAIAVLAPARSGVLPDVPTTREAGLLLDIEFAAARPQALLQNIAARRDMHHQHAG
jgi:sulfate adenylyltransferase